MTEQILVTYATQNGLTKEFAQTIANTLSKQGKVVDFRMISEVDKLNGYAGVVVGSPLHSGQWLPEVTAFVEKAHNALYRIPTAYFTVCHMVRENSDATQWTDQMFLDSVCNCLLPSQLAWFAGKQDCIIFPCGSAYWQGALSCRLQIFSMN